MNQKIISLVRSGKLLDILVGNQEFEILDHTNNEQDYLLIARELLLVARVDGDSTWVTRELEIAFEELLEIDYEKALSVLLAYLLVSRDMKYTLALDPRRLLQDIVERIPTQRLAELNPMVLAVKKLLDKLPGSSEYRPQGA